MVDSASGVSLPRVEQPPLGLRADCAAAETSVPADDESRRTFTLDADHCPRDIELVAPRRGHLLPHAEQPSFNPKHYYAAAQSGVTTDADPVMIQVQQTFDIRVDGVCPEDLKPMVDVNCGKFERTVMPRGFLSKGTWAFSRSFFIPAESLDDSVTFVVYYGIHRRCVIGAYSIDLKQFPLDFGSRYDLPVQPPRWELRGAGWLPSARKRARRGLLRVYVGRGCSLYASRGDSEPWCWRAHWPYHPNEISRDPARLNNLVDRIIADDDDAFQQD